MVKNTDFNGSLNSNLYKFQHYDISDISIFANGKHFPNESLTLGMDQGNTSVMCYRTLFYTSVIHHSNTGLQITHDIYETAISYYSWTSQLVGARRSVIRASSNTVASFDSRKTKLQTGFCSYVFADSLTIMNY